MRIRLPRLSFNAYTVAFAAAGLGFYAATAGEVADAAPVVKWIATVTIVALALSTLLGVLAIGQAQGGASAWLGQAHMLLLLISLVLGGTVVLNKIWKWYGSTAVTQPTPARRR